jgi:hypothetical protein
MGRDGHRDRMSTADDALGDRDTIAPIRPTCDVA